MSPLNSGPDMNKQEANKAADDRNVLQSAATPLAGVPQIDEYSPQDKKAQEELKKKEIGDKLNPEELKKATAELAEEAKKSLDETSAKMTKILQMLPNVPGRDAVIKNCVDAYTKLAIQAEAQGGVGLEIFVPFRFAEVWVQTYQAAQKAGDKAAIEQLTKGNSPTDANIKALIGLSERYGIDWYGESELAAKVEKQDQAKEKAEKEKADKQETEKVLKALDASPAGQAFRKAVSTYLASRPGVSAKVQKEIQAMTVSQLLTYIAEVHWGLNQKQIADSPDGIYGVLDDILDEMERNGVATGNLFKGIQDFMQQYDEKAAAAKEKYQEELKKKSSGM